MEAIIIRWCVLLAFTFSSAGAAKTIETDTSGVSFRSRPETKKENGVALIYCKNETNITIYCHVEKNSLQIATEWYIWRPDSESKPTNILRQNGIIIEPQELQNNVKISGEIIWNYITYSTNFTILNLTEAFNRYIIQCGTNEVRRTFILGFDLENLTLDLPLFKQNISLQVVKEGWSKVISLEVPNIKPFPPIMMTYWKFNGQTTTSSDAISYEDYGLLIYKADRNMIGNYTLTVSTLIGTTQESFFLDVLYEPVLMPVGGVERINESENTTKIVTLFAFKLLDDGNPQITVSWTGPKGMLDISLPGKFTAIIPGQLVINDVSVENNGTYVCTVNGYADTMRFPVDLMVEPSKKNSILTVKSMGFKMVISTATFFISGTLYFLTFSI